MANKFKKVTPIKDTEGGNFGGYSEDLGGGTPVGGIWGGQSGRVGWAKRGAPGHRQEQPRTKDGKFTYNSVNGKETKYESRGETVNPLLTDGENGIYIKDFDKKGRKHEGIEKQFEEKKGKLYDKYKNKLWTRNVELITKEGRKYQVKLSNESIWNIARKSFDISKGEFTGESSTFDTSKTGRHGAQEKQAIAEARKNKAETFVKSAQDSNAIKQNTGKAPVRPEANTGVQFTMHPSVLQRIAMSRLAAQPSGLNTIMSGQAFSAPSTSSTPSTPVATLKQGNTNKFAINPSVLTNLGNVIGGLNPNVINNNQPKQKKVSLAGFFHKK